MKYFLTIGLICMGSAFSVACGGSDDEGSSSGDGDGDSSGDGDSGTTAGDGDATTTEMNMCDPAETGETDCPEYVSCAETHCQGAYETCLGANYLSGDFTGGTCQTWMECVTACQTGDSCDDSCAAACEQSSECLSCMTNEIGGCVTDNCSAELQECAGVGGDGDLGGGDAVTLEGGCDDLEACCGSLTGDDQAACQQIYDSVVAGGDIACGVSLAAYTATGQCSL